MTVQSNGSHRGNKRIPAGGRRPTVYFQYSGQTALHVVGPLTGREYRFERPGAIVAVDLRDWKAIRRLKQLRLVAAPY